MRPYSKLLLVASILFVLPAGAHARGGGSHGGQHSDLTIQKSTDKASPKMMSRDAASGLASGKRIHKPITAAKSSRRIRVTPEKIEAGSENVRRVKP